MIHRCGRSPGASRLAVLVLVAVGTSLPRVARADGGPKALPGIVHSGHLVCLEYRDSDGVLEARCRPEHGTWAEAGPAVPVIAGRPILLPPPESRAAVVARGRRHLVEDGFLGGGLALGIAGLGVALMPGGCIGDFLSCAVAALGRIALGYLAAGVGFVVATVSALVRFGVDTGPPAVQRSASRASPVATPRRQEKGRRSRGLQYRHGS